MAFYISIYLINIYIFLLEDKNIHDAILSVVRSSSDDLHLIL